MDRLAQRFTLDAEHHVEQLSAFLTELPPEHLALAAEILRRAQEELGTTFTQSMVIPLADHISFAIKRVRQQLSRCAEKVKALLELRLGKPITADEVVYLTLHVAHLSSED